MDLSNTLLLLSCLIFKLMKFLLMLKKKRINKYKRNKCQLVRRINLQRDKLDDFSIRVQELKENKKYRELFFPI